MTIEPKLMSAEEVAAWAKVALLANPIERLAVRKLLAHIAAQDQRIAELTADLERNTLEALQENGELRERVADLRKRIAELESGPAQVGPWVCPTCKDPNCG